MSEPLHLTGKKAEIEGFVKNFDTFLFDCDGVLWSGDHVYDGVPETINMLREQGKRLVFVTNNSTKSRKDYVKKFAGLGITVKEDEVFGSSYSAAIYISRILRLPPSKNTVFVLGESGPETELKAENVPYIGATDPQYRRDFDAAVDFPKIASGEALDPSVGAVLLGLDFHTSYLKLALAQAYVRNGAVLLATNADPTLPMAGSFFPGAGSTGAGVLTATGKKPIVLGKPSQAMMDAIEGKFKLDRKRTCMVGDRLDTDIKFGLEGGLGGTLLVLTGVTQIAQVIGPEKDEITPMAYADKLGDLLLAKS